MQLQLAAAASRRPNSLASAEMELIGRPTGTLGAHSCEELLGPASTFLPAQPSRDQTLARARRFAIAEPLSTTAIG